MAEILSFYAVKLFVNDMAMEPARKKRRVSPLEEGVGGVPGFAKWDLEKDYERRKAKKNKADKSNDKLLVKTSEGWKENARLRDSQQLLDEDADADSLLAGDDGERDSGVADLEVKPVPSMPQMSAKEQVRQAKEELAKIAGLISESPEEHIGQLSALAQIARSENLIVRKLALGTQLAVYKDIIPGYRIRPLMKDDLHGKVSKDVKKLRAFEQTLLAGHREYVKHLSKLAEDPFKSGERSLGLSSVAIACACALLVAAPHFNQRNDLIAILVRQLSHRRLTTDSTRCIQALEQLFQEDEGGHASLEIVSQLAKMMKSKGYQVHEGVLNTFLHLRLLSEFAHKASTNSVDGPDNDFKVTKKQKQKREFRTKKERKLVRERRQVENEMKEADAAVSYEERDKNQAETLKSVFVTYFRILKERIEHLMGAVLEGLAKYSHLINQDFFGDVLEALKDLIRDAETLIEEDVEDDTSIQRNATRESLLCIITAFALLQGQQEVAKSANALHLDLNFFITQLYATLPSLALYPDIELSAKTAHLQDPNGLSIPIARDTKVNVATTTVLLLRSLQSVLLPPMNTKSVPPVRVAAFVKQLMMLSLHLPQKSATAVLGLLQQVAKTHGKKIAALWNAEERRGDGVFDGLSCEVESSNPFAATIWEGELLRYHFDPRVREYVQSIDKTVAEARA